MCGIAAAAGPGWHEEQVRAMIAAQGHRGPDGTGLRLDPGGVAALGHDRLAIIDLSPAAAQPMASADGTRWVVFNGEIYNYLELGAELAPYPFRSRSDTEVLLAAYDRWGEACLERFVGMFAFALWDARARTLFAARDRFGVKPLLYHRGADGTLLLASEARALHAAGVPAEPDERSWAAYLAYGFSDHGTATFWREIESLPAGHALRWRDGQVEIRRWYDPAAHAAEVDRRGEDEVCAEYLALAEESVRLRFRSDVPVGINLSGGIDSSFLLGLVHRVQGEESDVRAYTFATGDPRYDELPWVRMMLERTRHPSEVCLLRPEDVPALAVSVQEHEDEPFGGLPTLAYARLFETARSQGIVVLLDGQGMDEQWAGYEYYARCLDGGGPGGPVTGPVQASRDPSVRPDCLVPEFREAAPPPEVPDPFGEALRDRQYLDLVRLKIPRALRFNDRASMRSSVELREPFLDHRLVELALRQPADRKISGGIHKRLLRNMARDLLGDRLVDAPKRPLQTPQREWLREDLAEWAGALIQSALTAVAGSWLDAGAVRAAWHDFRAGGWDNSFPVWQWVNLGLWLETCLAPRRAAAPPGGA